MRMACHGVPSTPTRSCSAQEGLWLGLVPQEPLGFFTLCLQSLTCVFLEQFHFLPPYKRLLNLWTPTAKKSPLGKAPTSTTTQAGNACRDMANKPDFHQTYSKGLQEPSHFPLGTSKLLLINSIKRVLSFTVPHPSVNPLMSATRSGLKSAQWKGGTRDTREGELSWRTGSTGSTSLQGSQHPAYLLL